MRAIKNVSIAALVLAIAGSAFAQSTSRPAGLMVGDDAPALEVAKWVKGSPVESLAKGNIYVVEFWATWCGPCKVSIPHLTELQKKYGDKVTFIGVSSFETNWDGVEPFVKEMGDKMDYTIAMDKVSAPTERQGSMAKSWMVASRQGGIPTAFVVDKEGKVAWIGHPMNLDDEKQHVLTKIVDGTWDRDAAAKSFSEWANGVAQAEADPSNQAMIRFRKAFTAKDWKGALKAADDLEKLGGKTAPLVDNFRWSVYIASDDSKMISSYGKKLLNGAWKNDANGLNTLAWAIVDPKGKLSKPDYKLANMAAERAATLSERKEAAFLDTLAWTYHRLGQKDKAIETEKEAISKLPEAEPKADYEAALKTFGG